MGGGGWLDQIRMRLSQLLTFKLKLNLKLRLSLSREHHTIDSDIKVENYTHILNSSPPRLGRPKLDVHNIIYWFKNTRAAQRRAELRQLRPRQSQHELEANEATLR